MDLVVEGCMYTGHVLPRPTSFNTKYGHAVHAGERVVVPWDFIEAMFEQLGGVS